MIAAGHLMQVLEDWSPVYPGFYLHYPDRRQLPAVLRDFVYVAKKTASVARVDPRRRFQYPRRHLDLKAAVNQPHGDVALAL